MKKVLGLCLLCIVIGCSVPAGGGEVAIAIHEDGKIASRGYVITNAVSDEPIKVGDWIYFLEGGEKEKQGRYLEGQKDGVWTQWYDNGQKRSEGTFEAGKKEGVWTGWSATGHKWGASIFKNDEVTVSTWWDDKGNVRRIETWNGDELVKTETYKNGELVKWLSGVPDDGELVK